MSSVLIKISMNKDVIRAYERREQVERVSFYYPQKYLYFETRRIHSRIEEINK